MPNPHRSSTTTVPNWYDINYAFRETYQIFCNGYETNEFSTPHMAVKSLYNDGRITQWNNQHNRMYMCTCFYKWHDDVNPYFRNVPLVTYCQSNEEIHRLILTMIDGIIDKNVSWQKEGF
jgi:hypothetical protein